MIRLTASGLAVLVARHEKNGEALENLAAAEERERQAAKQGRLPMGG